MDASGGFHELIIKIYFFTINLLERATVATVAMTASGGFHDLFFCITYTFNDIN
jgi:hypothetical protein